MVYRMFLLWKSRIDLGFVVPKADQVYKTICKENNTRLEKNVATYFQLLARPWDEPTQVSDAEASSALASWWIPLF